MVHMTTIKTKETTNKINETANKIHEIATKMDEGTQNIIVSRFQADIWVPETETFIRKLQTSSCLESWSLYVTQDIKLATTISAFAGLESLSSVA